MASSPQTLFGAPIIGTTAQRPKNAGHGHPYYDTTVGQQLIWDADFRIWRSPTYLYDGDDGAKIFSSDFQGTDIPAGMTATTGTDPQAAAAMTDSDVGELKLTSGDSNGAVTADGTVADIALAWEAEENGGLEFYCRAKLNLITSGYAFLGFSDRLGSSAIEAPFTINASDAITSVASDAVGFVFDTDAGTDEWWAAGVKGDTDSTDNAATGTSPTADTYQNFRISITTAGVASLYIDDTLEATLTAAVTATVNLTPVLMVDTRTTASRILTADYLFVRPKNYPEV